MFKLVLPALAFLICCSVDTLPTGPAEEPAEEARLAQVPNYFEGFFVKGPQAWEPPGNMHILLLSWGDDIEKIGRDLRAKGAVAFVSTHCCIWINGHFNPEYWSRIEEEWLDPLREAGVLAGIYLVDEPIGNGISNREVGKGAAFVADKGYPTMAASVNHHQERLPVDYWSACIYSWGTKKEWARDWHRTSDSDWIVGQAFDAGLGYEKGIPDQAFWRETARITGKGIISWVWRWPGQYACADDPECRKAWGG